MTHELTDKQRYVLAALAASDKLILTAAGWRRSRDRPPVAGYATMESLVRRGLVATAWNDAAQIRVATITDEGRAEAERRHLGTA